ncbi:hypothetical protein H7097_04105 [Aeromicrobium sp.]|nr:hypothetical protein [Candidatus Saccharibacteria bacterium]
MANRVEYGKIERITGQTFDPVLAFMQAVPAMIAKARNDGWSSAHSYRGFHVAGTAYAINTTDKVAVTESGGNLKRETKGKVCVEKRLDGRLRKSMTDIIGFVVLGTSDQQSIEDVTGLATPTLHLCSDCRQEIPASPIVSPTTLIVHSGLVQDVNQAFTIGQEVGMYARVDKNQVDPLLHDALPDFHDWGARVNTYIKLTGGQEAACAIDLGERQRLAQLALSKTVQS